MRKLLLIAITLLITSSVAAETMELNIGKSYSDEDKNITILKIENKKALVCINNQKGIVSLKKRVDINGVAIEFKRDYQTYGKFDIYIPNCYKCICEGDCLNTLCQDNPPEPQQIEYNQTDKKTNTEPEIIEIIEPEKISAGSIIAVILITLVAILGLYNLWKKN